MPCCKQAWVQTLGSVCTPSGPKGGERTEDTEQHQTTSSDPLAHHAPGSSGHPTQQPANRAVEGAGGVPVHHPRLQTHRTCPAQALSTISLEARCNPNV